MEGLLQYIWQHKLWLSEDMVTNDGRRVRVLDPGLRLRLMATPGWAM